MAAKPGEELPEDFDEMMETARTEKVRKTKHRPDPIRPFYPVQRYRTRGSYQLMMRVSGVTLLSVAVSL